MSFKTAACFTNPDDMMITVTMTGRLADFERLDTAMFQHGVPFYMFQPLSIQIGDVSRKLRSRVVADAAPHQMAAQGAEA